MIAVRLRDFDGLAHRAPDPALARVTLADFVAAAIGPMSWGGNPAVASKLHDPVADAAAFYAQHELLARYAERHGRTTELPPTVADIARDYDRRVRLGSVRLAAYLTRAIDGELRHGNNVRLVKRVESEGHSATAVRVVSGIVWQTASLRGGKLKPGKLKVWQFAAAAESAFLAPGAAWSMCYGGKPWADIARVLRQFFAGEISAEVFVDTAYSLEHNTASVFNKGYLYQTPDALDMRRLLDLQRGGQVLAGLRNTKVAAAASACDYFATLAAIAPEVLDLQLVPEFDVQAVIDAGAVTSWAHLADAPAPERRPPWSLAPPKGRRRLTTLA